MAPLCRNRDSEKSDFIWKAYVKIRQMLFYTWSRASLSQCCIQVKKGMSCLVADEKESF